MAKLLAPLLLLLCLFSSCGKIGDVQPPFIRIPEAVADLSASQSGNNFVLTWTNPARNIDRSAADNLAHVQIWRGERPIAMVDAGEPGKPQSYPVPIPPGSDSPQTFNVEVSTTKGKLSKLSNAVTITPVRVPGKVKNLRAVVDQRRIFLTWDKPQDHPELADVYIVTRSDRPAESETLSDLRFDDVRYQRGKTVTYQVMAARRAGDRTIPGTESASTEVLIEDKTAPQRPSGLDILPADDKAFLTWEANTEADLAGYRVFRADRAEGPFKLVSPGTITPNQFVDPEYKSGMYYAVSAIDDFGNESLTSPAFRAP